MAFIFFCASVSVMLVNQIIPHHHHDSAICYESQSLCSEINHREPDQGEKGNNGDNCALCDIFKALIAPGDQVDKVHFHPPVIPLNDLSGHTAVLNDHLTIFVSSFSILQGYYPKFSPPKPAYLRLSDLRAPPLSV